MNGKWWHGAPEPGALLVSAPSLTDPNFNRTVVYLLEHGPDGSLGVIVNRPSRTPVGAVLDEWQEAMSDPAVIYEGGPVQKDGALCLAQLDDAGRVEPADSPITVTPGGGVGLVDLDADVEAVVNRAMGFRVFAGHSGWDEQQLLGEIAEGAWYVLPGRPRDVFTDRPADLWRDVLSRQPFPLSLVSTFPEDPSSN